MKAIDNKELILALEDLEKEKGIKKEYVLESIETALVTAYKRNFDALENVKVVMDKQTGATYVYSIKEVVERANDPVQEISLDEAKKINKSIQIGDNVEIEIVPKNFGRIAAQTAKQVIVQKIREAEREILYNDYSDKKGEIVSGPIQKAERGIVVMDLGKLEGVMPLKEQIPTENYNVNDKIKAYVVDVEKGEKGGEKLKASAGNSGIFWALLLFVGIPLPGTGAWTGSLIASVLEMDRKKTFLAVLAGVFMASIIMMLISFGVVAKVVG